MMSLLGDPKYISMRTEDVGPFRVTGLPKALDSLKDIFADIKRDYPDLYDQLKTAGMYNYRKIRGRDTLSNHAWGTAIDMKIGKDGLVPLGANWAYRGNFVLAKYFNAHGWVWGGGYQSRKDSMHYELSLSGIMGK